MTGNFINHPVVLAALERLKNELPTDLKYHVADHTLDVIGEVLFFAEQDSLSEREKLLLVIAASYHDLGFVEKAKENEDLGAEWAMAAMAKEKGEFTSEEIGLVGTMIKDSKVQMTLSGPKQVPTTKLSKYLLDADVSNLGREDFFEKAELVREEVGIADKAMFYKNLIKFISAHQWHSPAGISTRQAQKVKNIEQLKGLIEILLN